MSRVQRELKRQLASLRSQWLTWHRGGPHPEATGTICPERCGKPECEGCAATAYRADRCAGLAAEAAGLKARMP